MSEYEIATALCAQLLEAGLMANATGAGVHWQVEIGPTGSRQLRVHCFWYDRVISGLVLGMNSANQRSGHKRSREPFEGAEYLVVLLDSGAQRADGRTRVATEVLACARAWLAGVELDELTRELSFVEAKRRAMRALAARLDQRLRWEIGAEPSNELWVYGDGRSCQILAEGENAQCSFWIGQAPVATATWTMATAQRDLSVAVALWLLAGATLETLGREIAGIVIERHATVLELDPARWHWLHVADRMEDPSDVLTELRPLIAKLALSSIVTKFYLFSSMHRLCFSASSHYPWVNNGLPVIALASDGAYVVDDRRCTLESALIAIETTLAAYEVKPFFGSAPQHELPRVNLCLAQQGSLLRARLIQRGAWYRLLVTDATGNRTCELSDRSVTFESPEGRLDASWRKLDDAVRAVCRHCEQGASLKLIAKDSLAKHVALSGR